MTETPKKKFFLDKNVLEIARLCEDPLDAKTQADEEDGFQRLPTMIFFTPEGKCYFTNSFFVIEYSLPTEDEVKLQEPSQLQLFDQKCNLEGIELSKIVSVLGKELLNSMLFKSSLKKVGNFAVLEESKTKRGVLDFWWTSGIADVKASHLNQDFMMPEFDKIFRAFDRSGSKMLVSTSYAEAIFKLMKKIAKNRTGDSTFMIDLGKNKNQILFEAENLRVMLMTLKTESQ